MRLHAPLVLLALAFGSGCHHRPPEPAVAPEDRVTAQKAVAAQESPQQTLELVRLASFALADGDPDTAETALRAAVGPMQDFRADGELRALVVSERTKEWKGDPHEKMMAFLYLALLLLEDGDEGNALAMTKSAILADTGTSRFAYRADFVSAFVTQALVYAALGEDHNAERSARQASDVVASRRWTDELVKLLNGVEPVVDDARADAAARALLLSALPIALAGDPHDPNRTLDLAASGAVELRGLMLNGKKEERPDDLVDLRKSDARRADEALDPLVRAWSAALEAAGPDLPDSIEAESQRLLQLADDPPSLVLLIEAGEGPVKVADGRYGEILRIVPQSDGAAPDLAIDGQPISPTFLDSVTYQASTRGGRWVDGFLKGKAVFKDAAPILGWALIASGDVARAMQDSGDSGTVGTVLYLVGAATWVAGALTNPAADTRAWTELPEALWLVTADLPPGDHELTVGRRSYAVHVPEYGTLVHLIPALPPGGVHDLGGAP